MSETHLPHIREIEEAVQGHSAVADQPEPVTGGIESAFGEQLLQ
jgi:hypothetical protein